MIPKLHHPRHSEIPVIRRDWSSEKTGQHIKSLPIWEGPVEVVQKLGGFQNRTYFVTREDGKRFAARVGFDQYRTRQTSVVQCTNAAYKLGLGPELVYFEPNLTVTRFVEGKQMEFEQMQDPGIIKRVVERLKILHSGGYAVQESISYWWVFDTVRRYLSSMVYGKEATGFKPSKWVDKVPHFLDVTNRLEKLIDPYIPCFTHNDVVYPNMIFDKNDEIMIVDWDGGGYGHPMWDLGEMLMWGEADAELTEFALDAYLGDVEKTCKEQKLLDIKVFQVMSALRIVTEVLETLLDPYFYLTPEEMSESMKITLPDQRPELEGMADICMPRFEEMLEKYRHSFNI